jgi:hypothetical protein
LSVRKIVPDLPLGGVQFCSENIRASVFEEGLRRVCAAIGPEACGGDGGGGGAVAAAAA